MIIVSGEAGGQTKDHCKQLGAFGYFEKPIDFEALRTCLTQLTKVRRFIPRSEVRVRLRVPLKLRGTDNHGNKIEQDTTTENVSLSGFLCTCTDRICLSIPSWKSILPTAERTTSARQGRSFGHKGCPTSPLRIPFYRENWPLGAELAF